ncbi:MAG: RluA family pseudouridine synthase [Polyangiales bacterium]
MTDERGDAATIELELTEDEAGTRIDRVLASRVPSVSRTALQRWMAAGRIEMDGVVVSPKTKAKAGAVVTLEPEPPEASELVPEDIPLVVLFEDAHVLVLDKPAGLVVHPAPGHATGTLVHAVLFHTGARGPGEGARPGIVHRLDKDTSGVMVVAKTPEAHEALVSQFQVHSIERAYLALVAGVAPERVTYDTFHGRHPTDRKRFTSKLDRGRRAVTHVERLEVFDGASLVRCRLETGRTHQIRVHLSEHGHPLLGDPLYGRAPREPALRDIAQNLGRQALHAAVLGFEHPATGASVRFEAPPPADFGAALAALRA